MSESPNPQEAGAGAQDLGAALARAWTPASEGDAEARAAVVSLLDQAAQALVASSRSQVETLRALHEMLSDGSAVMPSSLHTAVQLTHERLADLRLRQLLAAAESAGGQPQGVVVDEVADEVADAQSDGRVDSDSMDSVSVHAPGRDWWGIPVDGLRGANQIFLLESRELMRGADLSLEALRRDPADFGEQMVLCRAFQAISVAADSMGLRHLATQARQAESAFDQLLDEGRPADSPLLLSTDQWLQALYRDLLELVGESLPPPPVAVQPDRMSEQAAAAAPEAQPLPAVDPGAAVEPASPVEPAPAADPAPAAGPPAGDRRSDEPPPWWWAVDWARWPEGLHRPPDALAAPPSGAPLAMPVAPQTPPQSSAIPAAAAEVQLRIGAHDLHDWSTRLSHWARSGTVSVEEVRRLRQEVEDRALLSLDAWSVPLYRGIKRAARESGHAFDFDLEGAEIRADAAALQGVMPIIEQVLCDRASKGGGPLRLRAAQAGDAVTLDLIDLSLVEPKSAAASAPNPTPVLPDGARAPVPWDPLPRMAGEDTLARLAARGGAWQATPGGWRVRLPQRQSRVPLLGVQAGSWRLVLPALWCQAIGEYEVEELNQALAGEGVARPDGRWPVVRLASLLKADSGPLGPGRIVWLAHGSQRMVLQVDGLQGVASAEPLAWPAPLGSWPARCGLWGVALGGEGSDGRILPVTDPFSLLRRFGQAARMVSRSRTNRPDRSARQVSPSSAPATAAAAEPPSGGISPEAA